MVKGMVLAALFLALPIRAWAQTPGEPSTQAFTDHRLDWAVYLHNQRQAHIENLQRYSRRGEFIQAPEAEGYFHRFIDDQGHRCAVAELIWRSGHRQLVKTTANTDNEIELATVRDGPLMEWILTSGLTQEELATLQRPGDNTRLTKEFLEKMPKGRSYAQAIASDKVSTNPVEPLKSAEFLATPVQDRGAPMTLVPFKSPRPHLAAVVALLQANHDISVAKALDRLGERVKGPPPSM